MAALLVHYLAMLPDTIFSELGYRRLNKVSVRLAGRQKSHDQSWQRQTPAAKDGVGRQKATQAGSLSTPNLDDDELVLAVKRILDTIPPPHYQSLKLVMSHLNSVARHESNRMTAANLASIVFPDLRHTVSSTFLHFWPLLSHSLYRLLFSRDLHHCHHHHYQQ